MEAANSLKNRLIENFRCRGENNKIFKEMVFKGVDLVY